MADALSLRAFTPLDLGLITARPDMAHEMAGLQASCAGAVHGWTVLRRGKGPVGCAWLHHVEDRHYLLTACVEALSLRDWAKAAQFIREQLARVDRVLEPATISASVRCGFGPGVRFLERFGFQVDDSEFDPPSPAYLIMTRRAQKLGA